MLAKNASIFSHACIDCTINLYKRIDLLEVKMKYIKIIKIILLTH